MGIFEKLQARTSLFTAPFQTSTDKYPGLELYRLEQRYTRREKRTTFISDARYVDGEYVYTPSPSSANSSSTGNSRRFSKMPTLNVKELKGLRRAGSARS
jgi:hypothetical protein